MEFREKLLYFGDLSLTCFTQILSRSLKLAKILVLYHSNTDNTRQMAELVAEGARQVTGADVRLRNITEADHEDLEWCDGIALGSPTNYGTISWQMKKWWDEQPIENWGKRDGKIGCVFSSAGAWGGGQEWTCMALMSVLINYGFLVFGLTDYTESDSPRTMAPYALDHRPKRVPKQLVVAWACD